MTTPHHDHPTPASGGLSKILKIAIPIAMVACVACLCCLGLALLFREPILELIQPVDPGDFFIDAPAGDGSVSGAYRLFDSQGGELVLFEVSSDRVATFRVENAPESETLTAVLNDAQSATMTWNGQTWDGYGPLTGSEQAALESLMANDLWDGLEAIPLKAGCRRENAPTPEQVAALLVPLQMGIKYQIADRAAEMNNLKFYALCELETRGEWNKIPSLVQMSAAAPVPVVVGYFPFDDEGAVEETTSRAAGSEIACLEQVPSMMVDPLAALRGRSNLSDDKVEIRLDETGPCDAKCRGACGADCHPDNCEETTHIICERDGMGNYTGWEIRVISYTCGLHEGCIEHDLCYDACNALLGCGTWTAAVCRHAHLRSPRTDPSVPALCDEGAIAKFGIGNTTQWVQGIGPQPIQRIFDYTDPSFPRYENPGKCPPGDKAETEKEPVGDPQDEDPVDQPPIEEKESETEKAEPDLPSVPDAPETEPDLPEPESDEISACDLLPVHGTIKRLDDYSCLGAYAEFPGQRAIQISDIRNGPPTEQLCERLFEPSDYHSVELELNLGDCGFRFEQNYKGESAPGYDGWGIMYYYKKFQVRVSTNEPYPEHQMWVFQAAEEIEETIWALDYDYD